MGSKITSLKPYIAACAVQALPIIGWASYPEVFGGRGTSDSFLRFLMWSNAASFGGGAIIGAFRVSKLSQAGKCLVPVVILGALGALAQSDARSEVAIYMLVVFIVSEAPAAILGCAIGAFGVGARAKHKSRP